MKLIFVLLASFFILIGGFLSSGFLILHGISGGGTGFVFAANERDVVINEIAWMGTKVDGVESKNWWRYEWLELYNNADKSISFDGWKIEISRTDVDWSLELKGVILPKSYFLIVASDKIPNYDLNYSNLGGKFINGGQKAVIKDNSGNVIDSLDCFSYGKWFAGDNETKQTMERKNFQNAGNSFDNWSASQNPGGTPKAENSVSIEITEPLQEELLVAPEPEEGLEPAPEPRIEPEPQIEPEPEPRIEPELMPEPELEPQNEKPVQPLLNATSSAEQKESQTGQEPPLQKEPQSKSQPKPQPVARPTGIVINELLLSAEGSDETDEWIELKNLNDEEANLSQWKIQDTVGSITTYVFPAGTKISPGGFLVLFRPVTKITLNNSGEGLKLIQPNGNVLDEVNCGKAILGQSYNKMGDKWLWSDILTPGAENIAPVPVPKTEKTGTDEEKDGNFAATEDQRESQVQSQLASVSGSKIPQFSESPRPFLIASAIAVFSGAIILFLKRKMKV